MKRFFIIGSALAFFGVAMPAYADTPQPPPLQKATDRSFDGRVEEHLPPDQGMNGILLDNGVVVRYPQSKADDVEDVATVGSNMRAFGVARMGPNKKLIVDAQRIVNLDTSATVNIAPPAPRQAR